MNNDTKEMVLQDICARLLYGLRVRIYNHWTDSFEDEILSIDNISEILVYFPIEDIKPYLRPLSSMTAEERAKLDNIEFDIAHAKYTTYASQLIIFKFMYEHHLDMLGLINFGLAIEAPADMYKF